MSIDQQTDDNIDDTADHSTPALDRITAAISFVDFAADLYDLAANHKAYKARLTKLRRLERDIAAAEQKFAAITAQAEQVQAALDARAAELDERSRALDAREAEFASQAGDVRDELHGHHARLEQTHRQLIHRIMSTTGILGEWNWDLQSPPTWEQLRRMIADLPPDLPTAPSAEVVSENVREDWAGNIFSPSTLTRSIHKEN